MEFESSTMGPEQHIPSSGHFHTNCGSPGAAAGVDGWDTWEGRAAESFRDVVDSLMFPRADGSDEEQQKENVQPIRVNRRLNSDQQNSDLQKSPWPTTYVILMHYPVHHHIEENDRSTAYSSPWLWFSDKQRVFYSSVGAQCVSQRGTEGQACSNINTSRT